MDEMLRTALHAALAREIGAFSEVNAEYGWEGLPLLKDDPDLVSEMANHLVENIDWKALI